MTDTSREALIKELLLLKFHVSGRMGDIVKRAADMLEADGQEISLWVDTLESRNRNIETLRAENVRLAQQVAVPETTDHSFIRAYEVGASVYRTQKEAARAISLGECERWTPLYRKQGAKQ